MREFDHNGLLQAEYQGGIFEKSADMNCSSPIFIRRFLHSDLLQELDNNAYVSYDIGEGIASIQEQFGDSDYGSEKYSKAALFWMGYLYRYISYTREQSTAYVMKLFKITSGNSRLFNYRDESVHLQKI